MLTVAFDKGEPSAFVTLPVTVVVPSAATTFNHLLVSEIEIVFSPTSIILLPLGVRKSNVK